MTTSDRMLQIRASLDRRVLRWQARLDSPRADRLLPWIYALLLFGVLGFLALARHRELGSGPDLGIYVQGAHLLREGVEPSISIEGLNVFAIQAAFIVWPLAQLTRIFPAAETLLVVQAAALSLAVVPIWRIGRAYGDLRVGACSAVIAAYAMYPPLHGVNLADFHPEALALPALLATYLQARRGKWLWVGALVLFVLMCRADFGLAVAALGVLLAFEDQRRTGWTMAIVGLGWFLFAAFVIQPAIGDGRYPHLDAFTEYGSSVLGVLGGMISDPVQVLDDLTSRQNFEEMVLLLAPIVFLPLVAPRYLLPAIPLIGFYFLADTPDAASTAQQDLPAIAFVFIAVPFALSRMGSKRIGRVLVDRRILGVLVLTAMVFFIRNAAASPYDRPWGWGGRDLSDQARIQASELLADDAAVRSSRSTFTLVAERETVLLLDTSDFVARPRDAAFQVDAVIFDTREAPLWPDFAFGDFTESLAELGFDLVYDIEGVRLYAQPDALAPGLGVNA